MMALFELQHLGRLPAGDVFSHSLWVTSVAADQDVVDDAVAAFAAEMSTAIDDLWTDDTAWDSIHLSRVAIATGTVLSTADGPLGILGGLSGSACPPQIAIVASHRTLSAGRSHRGRAYLPAPGAQTLSGTGLFSGGAGEVATAYGAYLSSLLASGHEPCVYSRVLHQTENIVRVLVDEVLDTQRRRRDAVVGTTHSAAVV